MSTYTHVNYMNGALTSWVYASGMCHHGPTHVMGFSSFHVIITFVIPLHFSDNLIG